MNLFEDYARHVAAAIESLKSEGSLPADLAVPQIAVEPPREASHGDLATNAALVIAKAAQKKPRDIAEALRSKLASLPDVAKAEVAGPGFINLVLKPAAWRKVVAAILKEGEAYGRAPLGNGAPINVEYVSANPTGPMHVGHCRGAVFGDALSNLLAFVGYKVTREYYINDAGAQVDVLGRSAFLRYREALGEDIGEIPEGLYPGDYLKPVGEALAKKYGKRLHNMAEAEWLPITRQAAIDAMLATIKDDLAALDVRHDVFFSERSLISGNRDEVRATIDELTRQGLVTKGRLPPPKGEPNPDWEDREQTLFKATDFGDDIDRALLKSDGSYTYFANDMAYHRNKLLRGFTNMINVFGADHSGYVKRMKAAVKALSAGKADLDIKVCQLVRVLRAGEPVRMSKRAGTFVALRDVVDEVGRDPVRFMMLYRKNDASLDFDLAKVIEKAKDNPVFYVQYAHARAASAFRNVNSVFPGLEAGSPKVNGADLARLSDEGETDLVRRLALFPELVAGAAKSHEPHRLAFYLYDLAQAFHSQWTRGNEMPHLRFIQEGDEGLTAARLALVSAVGQVIRSGLGILGVHAPEEMR